MPFRIIVNLVHGEDNSSTNTENIVGNNHVSVLTGPQNSICERHGDEKGRAVAPDIETKHTISQGHEEIMIAMMGETYHSQLPTQQPIHNPYPRMETAGIITLPASDPITASRVQMVTMREKPWTQWILWKLFLLVFYLSAVPLIWIYQVLKVLIKEALMALWSS